MRIGIDGTSIAASQRTGVGNYTAQLVHAVAALRPQHEVVIPFLDFVGRRGGPVLGRAPLPRAPNITWKPVRWLPGRVYQSLQDARWAPALDRLAGADADFFVFPNFVCAPVRSTARTAVVIHDLAFLDVPQHVPARLRGALERGVPRALSTAEVVVTVSRFTRDRVVEAYGYPSSRVVVVPPAVDHRRFRPQTPQRRDVLLRRAGLPAGRYVLFVGTKEPRKNLHGLLRAYRALPEPLRRSTPLVLAGGSGHLDLRTAGELGRAAEAGWVIELGYVPEDTLPALMAAAALVVLPSLYEGWGMPVLEALACGAPVVTSTTTALPEAAGGAAVLVDPDDVDALAAAIAAVLHDTDLAARLRAAGLARAAASTWPRSAATLLAAVEAPSPAAVA